MKLLTRLRELRNQATDFPIYEHPDSIEQLDNENMGVGTLTSSDIVRIHLENHALEKFNSPKK
jgi:hypothetical protein